MQTPQSDLHRSVFSAAKSPARLPETSKVTAFLLTTNLGCLRDGEDQGKRNYYILGETPCIHLSNYKGSLM